MPTSLSIKLKIINSINHSSFHAKNNFIDKSKIFSLTEISGALNNTNFDGNTILLGCEDSKYVYIPEFEIFEFRAHGIFLNCISSMGNNMIPDNFAVGEKYTIFISTH